MDKKKSSYALFIYLFILISCTFFLGITFV